MSSKYSFTKLDVDYSKKYYMCKNLTPLFYFQMRCDILPTQAPFIVMF